MSVSFISPRMPKGVRGLFVAAKSSLVAVQQGLPVPQEQSYYGPMLYDAHNHLQDERLDPWRDEIIAQMPQAGIAEMIVNGSSEEDWPAVAKLAHEHPWIRPAFGLHPWYVKERGPNWLTTLRTILRYIHTPSSVKSASTAGSKTRTSTPSSNVFVSNSPWPSNSTAPPPFIACVPGACWRKRCAPHAAASWLSPALVWRPR
jgi:hypothetical protein